MKNSTYAWITILFAVAFIGLGFGYYFGLGGSDAGVSWTALIPAIPGALLLVCGLAALKPALRKAFMHIAAVVALLSALAGTRAFMVWSAEDTTARNEMLAMFGLGLLLTVIYVKSFIDARRARAAPTPGS